MEVPGVGAGSTGTDLSSVLRTLAASKGHVLAALGGVAQSGDTITTILGQLSEPAVLKLLEIIDRPLFQENSARLESLLRASVLAAAEGDTQQALAKLAEFAALHPRRAETLESEAGLASIRPEVGQLLSRLASAARMDAESRLGQATQLLEAAGSKKLPGQEFSPEIALMTAGRLLEAGGYANCMCSAELSQMAINLYVFAATPAPPPLATQRRTPIPSVYANPGLRRQWGPRLRKLWRHAPLLVLLLAWFAIGFVGGSISAIWRSYWPETWPQSLATWGFDIWGVGFLGLVGFGSYMRVRNWRR